METIEVYIEKSLYQDSSSNFQVLLGYEAQKERILVGIFPGQLMGLTIRAQGKEEYSKARELQFRVHSYEVIEPSNQEGVIRYLGSGAIKGVGEKLARRIVAMFQDDTMRIIREEPECLAKVKGISMRGAQEIAVQVEEQKELQDAMIFLQKYGISFSQAVRIYERFGNRIYTLIRENPYQLADEMEGIGFQTADAIASQVGIRPDSEQRIGCGIEYTLSQTLSQGSTYLPVQELLLRAGELLSLETEEVEPIVSNLVIEKKIVVRSGQAYTRTAYRAEAEIASRLLELDAAASRCAEPDLKAKLDEIEEELDIRLDPRQRKAVEMCVSHGVFLLMGGPGTGKTTTINTMIEYFLKEGKSIALAAPTGRAAKRMTQATGYEAKTIHRLLEVGAGVESNTAYFGRDEENPLEEEVIIIDEMSMVDVFLMRALLRALDRGKRLILVGDVNQLPSVGPGQVFRDLADSGAFAGVKLETIFRQAVGSDIVVNAHRIQEGQMPLIDNAASRDFFFLERTQIDRIYHNIVNLVTDRLARHIGKTAFDVQVITPMRKGALGVIALNEILQKYINPPDERKEEHLFGEKLLRVGDKVMQMQNDYKLEWKVLGRSDIVIDSGLGVFNGDVGTVKKIRKFDKVVEVAFDDGRLVEYPFAAVDELELAYAITVHKSQGSEYEAVVLITYLVPKLLSYRSLLYTAVTRAKQCATLIGTVDTLEEMLRNEKGQERHTGLGDRIKELLL